jgi:hypothetical protein
MKRDL